MESTVSENKPERRAASAPQLARRSNIDWLCIISLVFLITSAANAAYRSLHDPSSLAFVAFTYADLILIFLCLERFEKRSAGGTPREKELLKAAVWALATALTFAFAWRVAGMMPRVLAAVVWMMAGSVALGGFYGLFICCHAKETAVRHAYVGDVELSPDEKA
ncbi:hypothetical protein MUK42_11236 [Musa troglodytarum]|uniref:Uncharacterized protein n=1 Tax=Musa troglodytarum TaxID=320322 RepID=A0A9E7GM41_9LILI|nr:hypothetical protein MUK42_11236 [Musa troglodytarum]